jgi:hypothetical protein
MFQLFPSLTHPVILIRSMSSILSMQQNVIREANLLWVVHPLTSTLKRFGDFGIFLIQSFASLFWEREFIPVRSVVTSQNINGRVQSTEGWFPSNLGETTVIRDKVYHFLLHILTKIFHTIGTFGKGGCQDHMSTNLFGIFIIFEGKTPILWKVIGSHLFGNIHHGRCRGRC